MDNTNKIGECYKCKEKFCWNCNFAEFQYKFLIDKGVRFCFKCCKKHLWS